MTELRPSNSEAFAERLRSAEARRNQELANPAAGRARPIWQPQSADGIWKSSRRCAALSANTRRFGNER